MVYALHPDLVLKLNALREQIAFSLGSGGRTETHNHQVGGSKRSKHLTGEAADLTFDSFADLTRAARWALDQKLPGIEVDETDMHLHLDLGPRVWRVWVDAAGTSHPLEILLVPKEV